MPTEEQPADDKGQFHGRSKLWISPILICSKIVFHTMESQMRKKKITKNVHTEKKRAKSRRQFQQSQFLNKV